tara:strand:+ start:31486 stop:31824 length:339 start_codon:yes stop_codon:yes gene_type:complete
MKKILILWVLSILFSSCYAYKPFTDQPQNVVLGTKYHFDLNNGKEMTKRIDSVGADAYYYSKGKRLEAVPFSEVKKLEQGSFSLGRTIGFSALVAVGIAVIASIVYVVAGLS